MITVHKRSTNASLRSVKTLYVLISPKYTPLCGNMLTFYNYVTAFFSVVVVNCAQPDNWQYCLPVHQWLPPYVQDARDFIENEPYYTEKEYLLKIDKNLSTHIAW